MTVIHSRVWPAFGLGTLLCGSASAGLGFLPPPAGCTLSTTGAANNTPIVIPTTAPPLVFVSTVNISGLPPFLWDLQLDLNVQHTFSADLDITLTSPSGTTATITTDNGSSFDNVFAGTTFSILANPGGAAPFMSNAGSATDHPYVNLVVATPLTPEESFAVFQGEDPNGTWTLTLSDDLNGDGGVLLSWGLSVAALSAAPAYAPTASFSNNTPIVIPTTAPPNVLASAVNVAGLDSFICDVDVFIKVLHTFSADLDITLTSPAGWTVTLTTDNGGGNDDVFASTTFDDQANPGGVAPYVFNNGLVTDHPYANMIVASPLVPEEALGAFIGQDPNGTWTLTISDDANGDGGLFNGWTLFITTCACGDCPADLDGTGEVDGADLGRLLANWDTPGADIDGDGTTDGSDLGILLGSWGLCPRG